MGKRYLDCTASEIQSMTGRELAEAIAGSEGRILVCETIGAVRPMLGDVTNAEFAAAMGADLLILNLFDVNAPVIQGLPDVEPEDAVREIKRLTGRAVGINLEPLEEERGSTVDTNGEWSLTSGRAATIENAEKAVEMGVDFIVLTGNPGVGVTNAAIIHTLKFKRMIVLEHGKTIPARNFIHRVDLIRKTFDRIGILKVRHATTAYHPVQTQRVRHIHRFRYRRRIIRPGRV